MTEAVNQNSDSPLTGECQMYEVNPVTGWAAQHVYTGELTVRLVRIKDVNGRWWGAMARMAVCSGCARQLDARYEAARLTGRGSDEDAQL